jgi:WD40 repeat protein
MSDRRICRRAEECWRAFPACAILVSTACMALLAVEAKYALATGTSISAPDRRDMEYDDSRGVLYISSGGSVLRYHLASETFLSPFVPGGDLTGMALSPDGNTLAVADRSYQLTNPAHQRVHLIDLIAETTRTVVIPCDSAVEHGTNDVAWGADGSLLVSSEGEGFLRRWDPATGQTEALCSPGGNVLLAASADGSTIGFAARSPTYGRYRVADGDVRIASAGGSHGGVSVNHDGTQLAVSSYGQRYTQITDSELALEGYVTQAVGVVYHPPDEIVYLAAMPSSQVEVYDTLVLMKVAAYDFEQLFLPQYWFSDYWSVPGRLKISRDGQLLFATVWGGIRYVRPNELPPRLRVVSEPISGVEVSGSHPGVTNYWQTCEYGQCVSITAPAIATVNGADYTFVKWELDGVSQPPGQVDLSFVVNRRTPAAVAMYQIVTHTLSVQSSPFSGVCIDGTPSGTTDFDVQLDDNFFVNLGPPFSLVMGGATWRFERWQLDGVDHEVNDRGMAFNIKQDSTAIAFYKRAYSLDVCSEPFPRIVIGGDPGGRTEYSDLLFENYPVTLSAPAELDLYGTDYTFARWVLNGVDQSAGDPMLTFAICTDSIAVAQYEVVKHALRVISTPVAGIAFCGHPAGTTDYSAQIDDNSSVSLTAPSSYMLGGRKYRFVRWELNGQNRTVGDMTLEFIINADATAVAQYSLSQAVTVRSVPVSGFPIGGTLSFTTDSTVLVNAGARVTLDAPAKAIVAGTTWKFVGWNLDGTSLPEGQATVSFIADHDVSAAARLDAPLTVAYPSGAATTLSRGTTCEVRWKSLGLPNKTVMRISLVDAMTGDEWPLDAKVRNSGVYKWRVGTQTSPTRPPYGDGNHYAIRVTTVDGALQGQSAEPFSIFTSPSPPGVPHQAPTPLDGPMSKASQKEATR